MTLIPDPGGYADKALSLAEFSVEYGAEVRVGAPDVEGAILDDRPTPATIRIPADRAVLCATLTSCDELMPFLGAVLGEEKNPEPLTSIHYIRHRHPT